MTSNSSFLVIALNMTMDPDSKIWEKWANLSDTINQLKEAGKTDEAWDLLLETAMETDPELVDRTVNMANALFNG